MFFIIFQPGFTGVCSVLTYQLELPQEAEPNYVQVMMSVPYNLNSYYAYLAVGIDTMYLNSTGLFDHLYYYTGPFERAQAGNLVEYTPEDGQGSFFLYFEIILFLKIVKNFLPKLSNLQLSDKWPN